ncbi:ribosome-binding protein 1-like [Manacus candei]|uniref:ribosome-binding protein 1-like n=1 Tax=Manacus candei TaxID=415023 RepID=UPI002227721E|nr:ribosome-binding protein 1-like [Manacus candei]
MPTGSTTKADKQPWHEGGEEMKDSSGVRKLPAIPGAAAAGKKQPGTDQAKGKPTPKGQGSKQSHGEETTTQRGRVGGDGEAKDPLGREGEKKVHLGREGASKDSLGKEGEKKVHLGREASKDSLGREGEKKVHLGREGASKDSLGKEGGKKVHLGREGASKNSLGKEGEKKVRPRKEGEKRVSPGRKGEKKVYSGRKGEEKVSSGRKREKKARFRRGVKYSLGREGEKKLLPRREEERRVALGRVSLPWSAQAWEPEGSTSGVSVVLAPGPEPAQGLRPRPEAFWSVLKEPQKSILAGYRFEPALFVPPLHPEGPPALRSPVLKKTEVVARGLWPWME